MHNCIFVIGEKKSSGGYFEECNRPIKDVNKYSSVIVINFFSTKLKVNFIKVSIALKVS